MYCSVHRSHETLLLPVIISDAVNWLRQVKTEHSPSLHFGWGCNVACGHSWENSPSSSSSTSSSLFESSNNSSLLLSLTLGVGLLRS